MLRALSTEALELAREMGKGIKTAKLSGFVHTVPKREKSFCFQYADLQQMGLNTGPDFFFKQSIKIISVQADMVCDLLNRQVFHIVGLNKIDHGLRVIGSVMLVGFW